MTYPTPITSDQAFDMIESIAAESSKKIKVGLVTIYSDHETFRKTLVYALDPLKTFNIRPTRPSEVMIAESSGGTVFDDGTWRLLDQLSARELTGNAAIDAVNAEFVRLTAKSADLLWRIINKDLRAGCSESTVNKAVAGLIPDFPYMRCCLPKDAKMATFSWVKGVYSQEKADGMFANVDHNDDSTVRITSRNGTEFPMAEFANLADTVRKYAKAGHQMHGELLVRKAGVILEREIGNGILNSVQQGGTFADDEGPVYVVWDQIPLQYVVSKGKYDVPYSERFESLSEQLAEVQISSSIGNLALVDTRIVHSMAEAYKHYGEMLAAGKEGTIIKDGNAIWRDGTSKQQVKLKLEAECDLVIVGFTEGNGKNKDTFGSIRCQTADGLLEVGVSGFKDKKQAGIPTRSEINDMRNELVGTIMTVRFNDIMYPSEEGKLHSLFLPRFVEFRRDKDNADSLNRVIEQYEAAKDAHVGTV